MVRAITLFGILSISTWAEPVREASSPAIIGTVMPAFYNGYLYSCEPHNMVTLFAPDGHLVLTLPMQGRGYGKVNALAVAIDSDGTLAIAWRDAPNAGIDIRDLFGNLVRSIDTGRYVPAHLSFGEDHALWTLGWQLDTLKPLTRDKQDYLTVRRYSIDGKETGAYLPRSLFPLGVEPGMITPHARRITVTGDRVGLEAISGTVSNQREWIELDLNGKLTGRWKLDPSNQFPGVVLTSDNQAYVHRYDRETKFWRVFRLDRAMSIWEPVNAPGFVLYGADGDRLVFAQWSAGVMHMSWFSQPSFAASTLRH